MESFGTLICQLTHLHEVTYLLPVEFVDQTPVSSVYELIKLGLINIFAKPNRKKHGFLDSNLWLVFDCIALLHSLSIIAYMAIGQQYVDNSVLLSRRCYLSSRSKGLSQLGATVFWLPKIGELGCLISSNLIHSSSSPIWKSDATDKVFRAQISCRIIEKIFHVAFEDTPKRFLLTKPLTYDSWLLTHATALIDNEDVMGSRVHYLYGTRISSSGGTSSSRCRLKFLAEGNQLLLVKLLDWFSGSSYVRIERRTNLALRLDVVLELFFNFVNLSSKSTLLTFQAILHVL